MKVRFLEPQQPVVVKQFEGKDYIYLSVNGIQTEDKFDENKSSIKVWEYDYHEIIEKSGLLDLADVEANPANYLDYKPKPELTDVQKLESEVTSLQMALCELYEMNLGV